VVGHGAAQDDFVAGLTVAAADLDPFGNRADAGGVDEDLVCLAHRHHLGVTGHDFYPGVVGGLPHGGDDGF